MSKNRELILNWNPAHDALKEALETRLKNPFEIGATGKGWTYVTFVRPGTSSKSVLYDIDRLELLANDNGYFLPRDIVAQHNKVVVTAHASESRGTLQLYGLWAFLDAYANAYANDRKFPNHAFYGKLGGIYDRPEKGRVLAMYATNDDSLLEILSSLETLLPTVEVPGVKLEYRLANGLSAIPRMLHGFDDPTYRQSGTPFFRIADPARFSMLLEQARGDYDNYLFEKRPVL